MAGRTIDHNSPPVAVKFSIRESQNLSPQVEAGVEQPVEADQPDDVIRDLQNVISIERTSGGREDLRVRNKRMVQTYGQFEQSFKHFGIVHLLQWTD